MSSLPPTQSSYNNILNGFFGNYSDDVRSNIWKAFLSNNQLPDNPDENAANLLKFSTYINNYYDNLLGTDFPLAEKTRVVWNIFDILLIIMKTMTNTQITSQQLQKYYMLKQQEYREEMNRTVLYVGTPPGQAKADGDQTVTTPSSDPSQFKLGYGDITLKEVFSSLVEQAHQNFLMSQRNGSSNDTVSFTLGTALRPQDLRILGIVKDPKFKTSVTLSVKESSAGTYEIKVRLDTQNQTYPNAAAEFFGIGATINDITPWSQSDTLSGTTTDSAYNHLSSMFYSMYNNYKGSYWEITPPTSYISGMDQTAYNNYVAAIKTINLRINWQDKIKLVYVGSDDAQKNEYAKQAGMRGEYNKRSQSFIDANKSRSDTIKDFSNQQASTVDQASNGRQQTSSIIQSIIQQLQTIMNSIFKA